MLTGNATLFSFKIPCFYTIVLYDLICNILIYINLKPLTFVFVGYQLYELILLLIDKKDVTHNERILPLFFFLAIYLHGNSNTESLTETVQSLLLLESISRTSTYLIRVSHSCLLNMWGLKIFSTNEKCCFLQVGLWLNGSITFVWHWGSFVLFHFFHP